MSPYGVRRRVAIVGPADATRTELADEISRAGFDVHECGELALPSAFADLVLLGHGSAMLACIRRWLRITTRQRIVVVTPQPAALDTLVMSFEDRLLALPAPVPAWTVLEVLLGLTSGPEFAP